MAVVTKQSDGTFSVNPGSDSSISLATESTYLDKNIVFNIENISVAVATEELTVNANSYRDYTYPITNISDSKILMQLPVLVNNGKGISAGRDVSKNFTVRLWNNTSSTVNVIVQYYVLYKK